MRVFRQPEYWEWLFQGEARYEFRNLPPERQEVAVRALLRMHMITQGADVVRMKQGWGEDARPGWFGWFGKKSELHAMTEADFIVGLQTVEGGGTFKVIKDRVRASLRRESLPTVTVAHAWRD